MRQHRQIQRLHALVKAESRPCDAAMADLVEAVLVHTSSTEALLTKIRDERVVRDLEAHRVHHSRAKLAFFRAATCPEAAFAHEVLQLESVLREHAARSKCPCRAGTASSPCRAPGVFCTKPRFQGRRVLARRTRAGDLAGAASGHVAAEEGRAWPIACITAQARLSSAPPRAPRPRSPTRSCSSSPSQQSTRSTKQGSCRASPRRSARTCWQCSASRWRCSNPPPSHRPASNVARDRLHGRSPLTVDGQGIKAPHGFRLARDPTFRDAFGPSREPNWVVRTPLVGLGCFACRLVGRTS